MTFKKFEELFKNKYPNGEVVAHGKFGGTEKNKKTTVIFDKNGKCYEYYGSYMDILNRVGINVVSKSEIERKENELQKLNEEHGKPNKYDFFGIEPIIDNTSKIEDCEEWLNIRRTYIIV